MLSGSIRGSWSGKPAALLFCLTIATGKPAQAQSNDLSQAAAPWLLIQSDVRSRGMGELGVALPDMAHVLGTNPALLLEARWVSAGVEWGEWLPEKFEVNSNLTRHVTLSGRGLGFQAAFGAAYTRLKGGPLVLLDSLGNASGQIEAVDEVTSFGLALGPHPNFSLGVTAKEVRSELASMTTGQLEVLDAWAYDGGVYLGGLIPQATFSVPTPSQFANLKLPYAEHWQIPRRSGFSIGITVRNLGEDVAYTKGPARPLPRAASVGFSYRLISEKWLGALFSAEIQRPLLNKKQRFEDIMAGVGELMWDAITLDSDPDDVVRWGVEISWHHLLDLRFGHVIDPELGTNPWTLGASFGPERLQVSWAHTFQASDDIAYPDWTSMRVGGTDFWGISLRF